jgi:hypothetical protein
MCPGYEDDAGQKPGIPEFDAKARVSGSTQATWLSTPFSEHQYNNTASIAPPPLLRRLHLTQSISSTSSILSFSFMVCKRARSDSSATARDAIQSAKR